MLITDGVFVFESLFLRRVYIERNTTLFILEVQQ